MRKAFGSIALCAWLFAGCSAVSHDEEVEPATLSDIDETVSVTERWQRNLAGDLGEKYHQLRPAFLGDRIFVAGSDGRIVAASADSGETIWTQSVDSAIAGGVAVGDGNVAVTTFDGELHVFGALDGSPRWQVALASEAVAPAAVGADMVVVQTIDGRLSAYASDDGKLRWSYTVQKPSLTLRGTSTPLIVGDRLYAAFSNGKLAALRVADGEVVWESRVAVPQGQTELERMVDADGEIIPGNGVLHVTTYQGRLATVAMSDGRVLWSRDLSSYLRVANSAEQLFAVAADGKVTGYDKLSSTELWVQEGLYYRRPNAPLFYRGAVVVGDFEGYLHFLAPSDGRFIGRYRVGSYSLTSPLVERNGTLFILGDNGEVTALQIEG